MRYRLKLLYRLITGTEVKAKLPHGQNPFEDIKNDFEKYSFDIFFDVGANIGQTVSGIRRYFQGAEIWCFEPIKKTYGKLTQNISDKKVQCFQIGFGSQKSKLDVYINDFKTTSDRFSLKVEEVDKTSSYKETVSIEILDDFVIENKINKIDYLKIDTEGYDLEVLLGASNLLKNDSVSFIETEVSMNPENNFHVKFEDVKQYLENFDYRLYGIYEQVKEWPTKKPILRRVNSLFVSKTVYSSKED